MSPQLPLLGETPVQRKRREPSPNKLVAYAALDLIQVRVKPILVGQTITLWRARNVGVAAEMAESGMSAAAIDDAHLRHSERRGHVTTTLLYVQRDLGTLPEPQRELLIDDVMPADELARVRAKIIAKRAIEDAEMAARAAVDPEFAASLAAWNAKTAARAQ